MRRLLVTLHLDEDLTAGEPSVRPATSEAPPASWQPYGLLAQASPMVYWSPMCRAVKLRNRQTPMRRVVRLRCRWTPMSRVAETEMGATSLAELSVRNQETPTCRRLKG